MRRAIFPALALGLLFCPRAVAQQRQVVYVGVDLAQAKDLAERPPRPYRASAREALKVKLAEMLRGMLPRCWDFQALPDPLARVAKYVITVKLKLSRSNPSTRQLLASLVLTDNQGGGPATLESQPLVLWGAGEAQDFIEGDWQQAFDDIPEKLKFYFTYQIPGARKLLIDHKVPIAMGLSQSVPGGAVLPIDYDGFQRNCISRYEISFRWKAGKQDVTITADGLRMGYSRVGSDRRLVQVRYRSWGDQHYDPAAHDIKLAKFKADLVYLKELRYVGVTNSDY